MRIYILEVQYTEDEEWTVLGVHRTKSGAELAEQRDKERMQRKGYDTSAFDYNIQEHNLRK